MLCFFNQPENNFKMFKSKNKSNPTATHSAPVSSGATNMVANGTSLEGTINAETDIRVDGTLYGVLNCKGRVIIGGSGLVKGDVNCQNAIIEGSFDGNLNVNEVLTVKESAKVDGEIQTGKLNIEPGAVFNGNCNMGGQLKAITPSENQEAV